MQLSMYRTQQILANAEASLKMEGFQVSAQTHKDCEDMLSGQVSADELVAKYVAQYTERE